MKRKLLLLALCALFGMSQAKAYTTSDLTTAGWTLVSSLSDNTSNVYVLVDAGSDNYAVSWHTSNAGGRPVYIDLPNPITTPDVVWTIESRGDKFALRNIISQYYFNSSSAGWDDFMAATYETGSFTFTYSNSKYSITAVSVTGNNYVGPWNNNGAVSLTNGIEGVAANKSSEHAPGFRLYKMAKATYLQKYLQNSPSLSAPIDCSFLIVNPTIYQNGGKGDLPDGWSAFTHNNTNGNYTADANCNTQLEGYAQKADMQIDYYQVLSSLCGGKYRLTARTHASNGTAKVYICNQTAYSKQYSDAIGTDYEDRTTEYVSVTTGNNVSLGYETTEKAPQGSWITADDFRLQIDPYISTMAVALPDGGAMTAGQWYSVTIANAGYYDATATTLSDIVYTVNGETDKSNEGTITANFNATNNFLSATTYYVKSLSDQTLTISQSVDADLTSTFINNPSFETNNKTGWTEGKGGYTSNWGDPLSTPGLGDGGGDYRLAYWTNNPTSSKVYQEISSLPAGTYKLSAYLLTSKGTALTLKAGSTMISAIAENGDAFPMEVYFSLNSQQNVEISAGTISSAAWYHMDNFKLIYNPTLPGSINEVSGKMNATVSSTQESRVAAYNDENGQTIANMLSAQEAINAAVASILVYNNIATIRSTYQSKADALDSDGQTAYSTAKNAASTGAETMYEAGTFATASDAETAYKRDYVTAVKAQTTDDTDMTEAIVNPSFETGDVTGWTNSKFKIADNTGFANKSGTYFVDQWHESGDKSIKQTLTGLHQGQYRLTAAAVADAGASSTKLYVKVGSTETPTEVSTTSGDYYVDFNYDGSSTLEIGFSTTLNSEGWAAVDNFRLTYLEPYFAVDADYTALSAAITSAEARTLGFENGEYAPYNNITILTKLANAKTIRDEDPRTNRVRTDIQTLTSDLLSDGSWTANDGEVNAISGGYNLDSYTHSGSFDVPNGWGNGGYNTRILNISESTIASNPGLAGAVNERAILVKYSTTYGESAGYTMPLKANTVYALSFKYGLWNEKIEITKNLSVTDPNGATITVYPGSVSKNEGDDAKCANVLSTAWYDKTVWFETGETAGDYVLNVTNADGNNQRQMVFSGLMLKKAVPTVLADNQTVAPFAGEAYIEMPRTYSSSNWNTLCLPFALNSTETRAMFSSIKKLNAIEDKGSVISMSFADVDEIAAGEPYLVKANDDNSSLPTAIRTIVEGTTNTVKSNGSHSVTFQGTLVKTGLTEDDTNAWVVKNSNLYNVNSPVNVNANRAYFTVSSSVGDVKALSFDFDNETGITETTEKTEGTESLFDLSGRRVSKAQKGLYIMNGRKVMVK